MKKTYKYPAIFEADLDEGGYVVDFPDLPGCITEGDTLEEAYEMAKEAMTGWLEEYTEKNEAPMATSLTEAIACNLEKIGPNYVIMLVEVDARELQTKAVRVNATLPAWMKAAADKRGINISQTLQKALNAELGKVG